MTLYYTYSSRVCWLVAETQAGHLLPVPFEDNVPLSPAAIACVEGTLAGLTGATFELICPPPPSSFHDLPSVFRSPAFLTCRAVLFSLIILFGVCGSRIFNLRSVSGFKAL